MGVNQDDIDQVVEGCQRSDRKCQEQLYRLYAQKMYAICLAYAKDKAVAQDILQDGFVKVFLHIKKFDPQNSLEGWIRRIITNTAIDYFRSGRRLNAYIELVEEHNSEVAEDTINKHINVEEILYFLRKLPDGARVIFNLYAIEGYSHKEIAEKLSISEGTSKSQYSRARGLLQTYLTNLNAT
jgi:RNA polymerase sigma-70 factor (ECF subfamily)